MNARTTQMVVVPEGQPLYGAEATCIGIEDSGEGEFVTVSQEEDIITINPAKWLDIRAVIDDMMENCKEKA